ncbi:MAG: M15 family metallopeptidase [Chitinophagales bacterium]|nr:M15 family metallopeptidase [Chitinophagales bacterium]
MKFKIVFYLLLIQVLALSSCKGTATNPMPLPEVIQAANQDTIPSEARDTVDLAYIMGQFDPAKHPDFVVIPTMYRDSEIRYLRKDVLDAFIAMYEAAKKEGITLKILSATRNFDNQKRIWENKWTGKTLLEGGINAAKDIPDPEQRARKILEYSSMPGTSRHHWGSDIDLNNFNNPYFEKGEGLKIYTWMQEHAHQYGFCQPYSEMGTDRNSGYFEEKWHWSYMPVSIPLTEQAKRYFKNEMIAGFMGSETAVAIDMLRHYILGISTACQSN